MRGYSFPGDRDVALGETHPVARARAGAHQVRNIVDPRNSMTFGRDSSNAEYVLSPVSQVLPLPDGIALPEGSVLSCNFGTAWNAARNAFAFPGEILAERGRPVQPRS